MDSLIGIVSVVLGIGFLIFIHELGHFLAAKWYDVKVEKFSIGFGPSIWEFRKGETVYALAWVPLGGYVAMQNEDGAPGSSDDPRSFPNKSVGARIAIMSAGVIMNVIFGLLCFIGLYGSGMMTQLSPILGGIVPGSPAYEAGLRQGDEIVAVGGVDSDLDFDRIRMRIMLSGSGETVELKVKRPGQEGLLTIPILPVAHSGDIAPTIGITNSSSLVLAGDNKDFHPYHQAPSGVVSVPSLPEKPDLKPEDRVVAFVPPGGEPVEVKTSLEFERLMGQHASEPVGLVVERKVGKGEGKAAEVERKTVALPPNRVVDLGMIMTPGPVTSLIKDGLAAKAGFKVGDEIISVDGAADFDPVRLPTMLEEKAGQPVAFRVKREGESAPIDLTITPERSFDWIPNPRRADQPTDLSSIGMTLAVKPEVREVRPGSPAAKAGIAPGQVVSKVKISNPAKDPKDSREITLEFDAKEGPKPDWTLVFLNLQGGAGLKVTVTLAGKKDGIVLEPTPVDGWWNPDRGLLFDALTEPMPALGVGAAIRRGYEETVFNIQSIYYTILRMFQGRVSTKGIGGPITIFMIGKGTASQGWLEFMKFLAVISVNLAVVNFLPIFPLDGGQLLLLFCEGIRGRPLPEPLMAAVQRVGLLLVVMLMVFAIGQDIIRTITG